jgi:hypothetical protein
MAPRHGDNGRVRQVRASSHVLLLIPAAIAIRGLCQVWFFASHPLTVAVDAVFDDCYYYLGVAWNLANGHGSKFRQPLMTNGYQPLWLLLMTGGAYVLSLSKRGLVIFCITASYSVQICTSSVLLFGRDSARVESVALGLAYVIALGAFPPVFSGGLETVLLSFGLLILTRTSLPPQGRKRDAVAVAALFFLLFLARVDSAALFASYLLVTAVYTGRLSRNVVLAGVVFLGLCSSYFAFNALVFGTPVPISGLAKSLGNRPGENLGTTLRLLYGARYGAAMLLVSWIIENPLGIRSAAFKREIVTASIALGLVAVYYGVFSGWPVWGWYYWPGAILFVFALARLLLQLRIAWLQRGPTLPNLALVLGVLFARVLARAEGYPHRVIGPSVESFLHEGLLHQPAHATDADWTIYNYGQRNVRLIERFLPHLSGGTLLMGDRAGSLGYWMPERFRMVQAEGIVADLKFMRARQTGQVIQFLRANDVDYVVVDREILMTSHGPEGLVYGVAEPVLGLSAHSGTFLMCFPESAVLFSQDAADGSYISRVFDFHAVLDTCPVDLESQYRVLADRYAGLNEFSMPHDARKYIRGWEDPW